MNQESDLTKFVFNDEKKSLETYTLWEEAGFIPPKKYLYFIELLHLLFFNYGNNFKVDLIARWSDYITKSVLQSHDSFFISDPEKLYLFAEEMKIEIENIDDKFIAAKITAGLIAEYVPFSNLQDLLKDERKPCSSLNIPNNHFL